MQAKRNWLKKKLGYAGIPPRFMRRGFDTYEVTNDGQAEALRVARDYAAKFEQARQDGLGLIFMGPPGTGKTHLATAICKSVIRDGRSAVFASVLDVVRIVRETYRPDSDESERAAIKKFVEADVLALDEVGVQHDSDYERIVITDIINQRYEQLRPTILLSNLNLEQMEKMLGQRVMDRMREVGQLVVCDWESHRG